MVLPRCSPGKRFPSAGKDAVDGSGPGARGFHPERGEVSQVSQWDTLLLGRITKEVRGFVPRKVFHGGVSWDTFMRHAVTARGTAWPAGPIGTIPHKTLGYVRA